MAQPLQFQLSLTQTFSAALAPVIAGLGKTEAEMADVKDAAKALDDQFTKVRARLLAIKTNPEGFKQLAKAENELREAQKDLVDAGTDRLRRFFTFDIATGARMAIGAIKDVSRALFDLGRQIIKTAGDEQDINLALNLTAGPEKAKAIRALADSFAETTRFDDDFVKQQLLPLMDVGITDTKLLDNLATAAGDVAARQATGKAGFESAMSALQRLAITGVIENRSLMAIGVNQKSFYQNLGQLLGVSEKEAQQLTQQGKVKSKTLLSVALDEIAKREGGRLGNASLQSAKTMGGTLQRLQDLAGNVFKRISDGPGMKRVQESLSKFIEQMNGPIGDRLMARVDKALSKLGEFLSPERIETWLTKLVDTFDRAGPILDKVVTVSEVLATIWAGSKIVGTVSSLVSLLPALGTAAGAASASIAAMAAPLAAVAGAAAGVYGAYKLFQTAKGFSDLKQYEKDYGIAGKTEAQQIAEIKRLKLIRDQVRAAKGLPPIGAPAPSESRELLSKVMLPEESKDAAGKHAGATIHFAPQINVHGVESDPKKVADEASRHVRVEFMRILDDIGLTTGVKAS